MAESFTFFILQGGDKIVLNLTNYSNNDVRSLPESCLTNKFAETATEHLQNNPFKDSEDTENIRLENQSNNPFICNDSSAIEKIVDISENVS